jgi:hypothetical protein
MKSQFILPQSFIARHAELVSASPRFQEIAGQARNDGVKPAMTQGGIAFIFASFVHPLCPLC